MYCKIRNQNTMEQVLRYYEQTIITNPTNFYYDIDVETLLNGFMIDNMSDMLFNYVFKQRPFYIPEIPYTTLLNTFLQITNFDRQIYFLSHFVRYYYLEEEMFTKDFIDVLNKIYFTYYRNLIWDSLTKEYFYNFIYLFQHQIEDKKFYLDACINVGLTMKNIKTSSNMTNDYILNFFKTFFKDDNYKSLLFILNLGGN